MARMIPRQIAETAPASEKEIFRRLRDETPDSWTAVHSQGFVVPGKGGQRSFDGEADFVVLDPRRGFLALEVKGGGIRFEAGSWYSRNREQQENRVKAPAGQAVKAAHAIADLLRENGWFKSRNLRLKFGWGVIFPDVDLVGSMGAALQRDRVIDRMDCTRFRESIDRLFDAQGLCQLHNPNGITRAFESTLCPRIDAQVCLSDWFARDRKILERLTAEQQLLLGYLEETPRLAIRGAAGSGKTILAMEKARRLEAAGRRVLFLCFNRPLAEYLRKHADGFEVATFHDFSFRMAQRAGLDPAVPKKNKARSRFFRDELPLMVLDALAQLPDERYDALVVDEGQDFQPDWWDCVKGLLADPDEGIWYVFYDPVQDIYGGAAPAALESAPHPLIHNCRNTKNIAAFCGEISGVPIHPYPSTPVGVEVEQIECATGAQAVTQVGALFKRLISQQKVPPADIVVLSTTTPRKSVLAKAGQLGPVTLAPLGAKLTPNQVRFDSLFRFKGLEADIVILIDEAHSFGDRKAGLYVGASRARHLLVVVTVGTQPLTEGDRDRWTASPLLPAGGTGRKGQAKVARRELPTSHQQAALRARIPTALSRP